MASNQSTTNSSKKRILVIAIVLVLLLASLFLFKSCSRNESLQDEQEITNTVPNDAGKDKEENVVQENYDGNDQSNNIENVSLNSNSENSTGNTTQSINGNNDVLSNASQGNDNQTNNNEDGSQDSNDELGSVPNPEKPNIPQDHGNVSILKLLYDELIKANNTFQYFLELTNEILEDYW